MRKFASMVRLSSQLIALLIAVIAMAMAVPKSQNQKEMKQQQKMQIEIWSDIVCPWCYIGKRRFEKALADFEHKDKVEVIYRSYQLDPQMQTDTSMSVVEYLSIKKGISEDQAIEMSSNVTNVAATEGLTYHMDRAIPINTLKAHGLLHFAKTKGVQIPLKEKLMEGYFTLGLNLDDDANLIDVAAQVGLDRGEVQQVLTENRFHKEVQQDIHMAVQFGLRGVPFYVFDRKYGVSGAQPTAQFATALTQSYDNWVGENATVEPTDSDGASCTPEGQCE